MNDKTDNSNAISPEWELMLARQVRELDREIQPNRDLWAGIERKIESYPQAKKTERSMPWMGLGMAASVLMAFSAMVLSVMGFQNNPDQSLVAFEQTGGNTLETMQVEYLKTRDPLVQQFTENNRNLGPETLEELYRNIEIMAEARRSIESQVRKDPTNRRLVEQLMRIHEQELALLKQDFSQPGRSM